jgi:hypothetical protein
VKLRSVADHHNYNLRTEGPRPRVMSLLTYSPMTEKRDVEQDWYGATWLYVEDVVLSPAELAGNVQIYTASTQTFN